MAVLIQSIVVVWPVINTAQRIPRNRKYTVPPPAVRISKLMGHFVNERDGNLRRVSTLWMRHLNREKKERIRVCL